MPQRGIPPPLSPEPVLSPEPAPLRVGDRSAAYPWHAERGAADPRQETGYLADVARGDKVEILAEAEEGHAGNLFPRYRYVFARSGAAEGWFPLPLLAKQPTPGCWALVHGLAKHTELDGRRGQVVGFQHGRCGELRWQVRMNGRVAAFRESNLHFATCEADLLALSSRRLLLSCHFDHARSHAFAHLLQLVILQRRNG